MTEDHRRRAEEVFLTALEKPLTERAGFAEQACGDEPEVLREVLSLLAAAEDAESYLDALAEGVGAPSGAGRRDEEPRLEGQRIGPYRLVREIGRGGAGTVYLAEREDGDFEQRVAIKLLRRGLDTDDILARFRVERQILASLNHPHIARLFDGGAAADGRPYLVMELVEGLPITEHCDRQRLSLDERLKLFVTVTRAVQYAHHNLVVHRDIKSSNILVTASGTPKLLDFGIAKLLDETMYAASSPQTRTGMRLMTPEYASPEQVRGDPVTTASDAYQLGMLLYQLLTGRRPYRLRGCTQEQIERTIREQERTPPSKALVSIRTAEDRGEPTPEEIARLRRTDVRRLLTRLRGDLDTILLKAVHAEPERRYASAGELADDLERYLSGQPVAARPDTWGYRTRKLVRRRPGVVVAVCAAALTLGAYSVIVTRHAERLETERDRAHIEAAKAEQITAFVLGLFEVSNPAESRGEMLTARDLLESGMSRVEQLESQPEVQAEMLYTLARVHASLGMYGEAVSRAERALELQRRIYGREHAKVGATLSFLSATQTHRGELAASEPLAREALAMRRRLFGSQHTDVAESLNTLGRLLHEKGSYEEAEPVYRKALAIRRELLGHEHPSALESLHNLASLLRVKGSYAEAEVLFREALAGRRSVLGSEHPDVTYTLNNLASLLEVKGEFEEAEAAYHEVLALRRRIFGDDHPHVARSMNNLGLFLMVRRKNFDGAEPMLREALEIRRRTLGATHRDVAQSLNNLGGLYREQGDYVTAESWFREALEVYRRALGDEHPEVSIGLNNVGAALRDQGRHAAGEPYLREALAMRRRLLGDEHPWVAVTLHHLGLLLRGRGDLAQAESAFREALAIRQALFADDHPAVIETRDRLAELLR